MDRILIPALPLRAHIGVTEAERAEQQEIIVEVELGLDLRGAGSSDDLDLTVDYDRACEEIVAVVGARHFRLVEAVAETCAQSLLQAFPRVHEVLVQVRKPGALRHRGAPYAAAEVVRNRG